MTHFMVEIREVSTYTYFVESDTARQANALAEQLHEEKPVDPSEIDWDSTKVYARAQYGWELEEWDD